MVFPLLALPDDVVTFHLASSLDAADIVSLFLTCRQLYHTLNTPVGWHTLYVKSFPNETSFDSFYRWGPQLYRQRFHSRLQTFGSNGFGRLGEFVNTATHYELVNRFVKRLYRPVEVQSVDRISDISAGGFSFQILTTDGLLYYTGRMWHGGIGMITPGPVARDEQMPRSFTSSPLVQAFGLKRGTHFVAVSSGRAHFVALDNKGILWTWDSDLQGSQGVPIRLVDVSDGHLVEERIVKIRAGWSLSSCLLEHSGIVLWKRRETVTDWKDGYPLHEDHFCTCYVSVVPGTGGGVVADYVVLSDCLVYLTRHGRLFRVDLANVSIGEPNTVLPPGEPLVHFEEYILHHGASQFVRLSGCFKTFAAISNGDDVLIGRGDNLHPHVVKDLQNKAVTAVSAGDYHYLALTKDGKLYSWGRESKANGCLGLGRLQDILDSGKGTMDGMDLVVEKPTLVDFTGRVLAIAAAGWQSAALVVADS